MWCFPTLIVVQRAVQRWQQGGTVGRDSFTRHTSLSSNWHRLYQWSSICVATGKKIRRACRKHLTISDVCRSSIMPPPSIMVKPNKLCCLPGARRTIMNILTAAVQRMNLWSRWAQWTLITHLTLPQVKCPWLLNPGMILWCRPSKVRWRSRQLPSWKGLRSGCRRPSGLNWEVLANEPFWIVSWPQCPGAVWGTAHSGHNMEKGRL